MRKFITGRCIFPRALKYLKEAVDYQENVLDTQDELIHTHQAMSIALRALGRDEEAEEIRNESRGGVREKAGFLGGSFR